MSFKYLFLFIVFFLPSFVQAQQVADTLYHPEIVRPAFENGKGPVVMIDEGHHNFHTASGRYLPFANLLRRDGFIVKPHAENFTEQSITGAGVLVISNALHVSDVGEWVIPNPSAFTKEEILAITEWVKEGGRLLLIADHMPFAGAAAELASAFGFEFTNGFVVHDSTQGNAFFIAQDGTLGTHQVTMGRDQYDRINRVMSFTGQAFRIPETATSILTFGDGYTNLLPDTAWAFNERTPKQPAKGWSQGAVMNFGKGRIAVFGEAAMFSAQLSGPRMNKAGMNHPDAGENYKLLLNVVRWLTEGIE